MARALRENDPGIPESERAYSADVPTYDTYPAEPPLRTGWRPADRQLAARERNPRLEEGAERIGSFVGEAVNRGREAVRRFDSMKQDARSTSQSKMQELTDRASEKFSEVRAAAQERLEDWRDAARESANNVREIVVNKTREARTRARDYTNQNPHHILLAIAGLGFAIGLAARLMRRSHD